MGKKKKNVPILECFYSDVSNKLMRFMTAFYFGAEVATVGGAELAAGRPKLDAKVANLLAIFMRSQLDTRRSTRVAN